MNQLGQVFDPHERLPGRELSRAEHEAAERHRLSEASGIGVVESGEEPRDGRDAGRGAAAGRCACSVTPGTPLASLLRSQWSEDEKLEACDNEKAATRARPSHVHLSSLSLLPTARVRDHVF